MPRWIAIRKISLVSRVPSPVYRIERSTITRTSPTCALQGVLLMCRLAWPITLSPSQANTVWVAPRATRSDQWAETLRSLTSRRRKSRSSGGDAAEKLVQTCGVGLRHHTQLNRPPIPEFHPFRIVAGLNCRGRFWAFSANSGSPPSAHVPRTPSALQKHPTCCRPLCRGATTIDPRLPLDHPPTADKFVSV
jgi:hypothetical protein